MLAISENLRFPNIFVPYFNPKQKCTHSFFLLPAALQKNSTREFILCFINDQSINFGLQTQWWILGEANEAVASNPLDFRGFLLKIERIVFIMLQMFFRDHSEVETKNGKYKID